MSVIISRALPDVRDGLKPSQRRILVAMRDLGLNPGSSTSKCDALLAYLDNPAIDLDEIMEYLPGPDFPTGATICGRMGIKEAYRSGRGRLIVRAKYSIEEQKDGRSQIVFTEIPYQLTKEPLL